MNAHIGDQTLEPGNERNLQIRREVTSATPQCNEQISLIPIPKLSRDVYSLRTKIHKII